MVKTGLAPLERSPLLHVSVQESLRAHIGDNRLGPGAPLPPEGTLARQLGVSRNSVREAIKSLESLGILESRRGIGIFVKAFSFEPLLDNLAYGLGSALKEIEEVLVIRRTLEVGLIEQAVAVTAPETIAALRAVLDDMKVLAMRGAAFPEEDRKFHRILFGNLENEVLTRLLDVFWLAFYKASDFANLDNSDPVQTWRDHVAIVDAVERHDAAAARVELDAHYAGIGRVIADNKKTTPPR
jgi:DNA-binding FadR family transcriptional regulator